MGKTLIAEYSLQDGFDNKETLLVYISPAGVHYSLFGSLSRIPLALANLGAREPFPNVASTDLLERVDRAIKSSRVTVLERTVVAKLAAR